MKHKILIFLMVMIIFSICCKSKKGVTIDPSLKGSDKTMYENGLRFIRKDPEKARLLFKEVIQLFPNSIYTNKSKLAIADSYFKQKDAASLVMAAAEYQEYVNLYPFSPDAVYAKFQVGMCYYKQMKKPGRDQTNTFNTIRAFEGLISQYPGTPEAENAKKKIEEARQDLASHYFRIGYYNYKFNAFRGAIERFKHVINEYPEFKMNDKLYYFTGKAYLKLKEYDSAISFFQKIINSYPKSKYLKRAHRKIKKIQKLKEK